MTSRTQVVYQGEPGAFSEEAVLGFFGEERERAAVPTWRAVFEAVADGSAAAGVIAIESSLAGTIRETYDLLAEFYDRDVRIVGEVSVPVRLALLALPGQSLDGIERVYSHAQALVQADAFLRSRAVAGHDDLQHGRRGADDRRAARSAGRGRRLAPGRSALRPRDPRRRHPDAATRTGPGSRSSPARAPTRRAPTARDRRTGPRSCSPSGTCPGSLHRCLGAFAARGVNLSSLESRPARRPAGSTCSGSTSMPRSTTRRAPRPSTTCARRPRWSGSSALPARSRTDASRRPEGSCAAGVGQIALAQARHFDASTAFASLQNGQVLTSAGGGSLMKLLLICQTTNAITMKAMIALMNAP